MNRTLHLVTNFLLFGTCFALSYLFSLGIFSLIGTPPELWRHVISGIFGCFLAGLFHMVLHRKSVCNRAITDIFNALDQIAQGNFNVFVEKNVDDGHRTDELVDRVNNMARELNSMEQLRQDFISNVSHEFRSPLTSISGYAALLRKEATTPEQVEYARIIEAESKRLSKLSEHLLLLSVLEDETMDLNRQDFRLDRQIEDVILLLEPQWTAKTIGIEVSLPKTTLSGSEDLLRQVWMNLLANAIKFTPEGGTISVQLEATGDRVVCRVRDNGIGIPAQDQIHIFERFYKVDKAHSRALGGNGLGLSLVKKITELHGGTVGVESLPGEGSTFTVSLPRQTPAACSEG